ncbi:hypothetical protein RN001_015320 [Aquatica leii]|uniref:Serine aminopeptidase S33 domain-containing protein n=1 Tax=Aquatica leii TaxID=1421715 RepID=A0AAN7P388_9COLE|nr:hypothetical protein RN001_015320 [Aquatica leii]
MQITQRWKKCITITVILAISLILTFFLIFLGIPLSILNSEKLQRHFVFPTHNLLPENPDYENFHKYNIYGGRNLYVYVNNDSSVYLGVWHLLPHVLADEYLLYQNYDYENSLAHSNFPVVMHFHANGGNRIKFANMYHVLRKFFHVIAFDYRGYGDSTSLRPTEIDIVQDSVNLYKWLRDQTEADIYFWGHSVGATLSAHTLITLQQEKLPVKGLFLEAPFTTIQEQIQLNPFYKFFSWLPWYKYTMVDSLPEHGFVLNTTEYLLSVKCCIMIVHAKDDRNSPFRFSEELYGLAQTCNKSVTLHLLPDHLRCGHYSIRKAPQLPEYIRNHIRFCRDPTRYLHHPHNKFIV